MRQEFLPTDLTDEERRYGFELRSIENPQNRWGDDQFGQPQIIRVVAKPYSESEWVFKIRRPDGVIEYSRQQYGVLGIVETYPEWNPVGGPYPTLEWALKAASQFKRECDYLPKVPPIFEAIRGVMMLCYLQSQLRPQDITRHRLVAHEQDGCRWACLPIEQPIN